MMKTNPIIDESCQWLLKQQDPQCGGWGQRTGMPANVLNTAEAILALRDGDYQANDSRLKKGAQYLVIHQLGEGYGLEEGAWARDVERNEKKDKVPDIVRTCLAVQALLRMAYEVQDEPVKKALAWLAQRRNKDGGWGFSRGGASALAPTCIALLALVTAVDAGAEEYGKTIGEGIGLLRDRFYNPDGHGGSFGRYPPLVVPHTLSVTQVLQAVLRSREMKRRLNVEEESGLEALEAKAVVWLLRHEDEAKRVFEEVFEIDPVEKKGNYSFRYMAASLLIQVLACSPKEEVYPTVRQIRESVLQSRDPEGGFYGDRTSAWATARALSGLIAAESVPPPPPDPVPVPVPNNLHPEPKRKLAPAQAVAFSFVALLILVVVYLTVVERLALLPALSLGFLMLCVLVIGDWVSGWAFMKFLTAALRNVSKPGSPASPGKEV